VHRSARSDDELAALERDIADVGYYSFVTTASEAERLATDEPGRDELLHRLMTERVAAWLALATERLADGPVPLYLIPGNDDDFVIDSILNRPQYTTVNADGKVLDIPGDLQLLASGWSNFTPWQTPREETEDELYARLEALAQQVRDPRRAVFMIHVPPHDSGLDTAPLLDENLRPTVSAGDVLRGPVGSTAVRRLIENYQPLLAVHGHIHESGGERKIGKTLCINPGSEANHGILRGYLIDVGRKGIELAQRVEG
jgi:Icc-related predicted phosphoesterase